MKEQLPKKAAQPYPATDASGGKIVRPAEDMPYPEFKQALEGTQGEWKRAKKEKS